MYVHSFPGSVSPARSRRLSSSLSLSRSGSSYRYRGLGAASPAPVGDNAKLAQQSGSLASAGLLISAAVVGGPVGAIIAGAAAAVIALTSLFTNLFSGCGQTCIQATHVVDTVEAQYLKPLRAQWDALPPSSKTQSVQKAYLQVFDYAWSMVLQGCGDPALGDAGRRCISERQAGGTVPGTGGNWFIWYRDPIANDPNVIPDPPGAAVGSSLLSTFGISPATTVFGLPLSDLVLPGILIVAAFTVSGK